MVWTCDKIRWAIQDHTARNSTREEKARQAEEEMGRQHHRLDQEEFLHNPGTCSQPPQMEPTGATFIITLAIRP